MSLDKINESFQSAEDLSESIFLKLLSFCYDSLKSEFVSGIKAKFGIKINNLENFRNLILRLNGDDKEVLIGMYYDYYINGLEELLCIVSDDEKKEKIRENFMRLTRSHMISIFARTYDLSTVFKNKDFVVGETKEAVMALFAN